MRLAFLPSKRVKDVFFSGWEVRPGSATCSWLEFRQPSLSMGRKAQLAQLGKYIEQRGLSRLLVLMPFYTNWRFLISKAVL